MTPKFSVVATREQLRSETGYDRNFRAEVDLAKSANALASYAHRFIYTGIQCFLAGFDDIGRQLCQKAIEWITHAIETNERPERYFEDGSEASRAYNLTLAKWLLGLSDPAMLEEATNRWAAYYQNKKAIDTVGLSLSMVYLADGRRDDLVAELAAKHWRNKRLPAEVAATVAVCGDRASAQRMHPIVANLLGRKGDEWLTRGHFDRFAAWVKVGVADRDAGLSRPEILRDAMSAALKVK